MACPYFSPTVPADDLALPHPGRLPLAAAWRGKCTAAGHEQAELAAQELESCNLGYASACPRLPKERAADAVRFAVRQHSPERILVQFVLEAKHLPVESGTLEYDRLEDLWPISHSDPRIQNLASYYLRGYLGRNRE